MRNHDDNACSRYGMNGHQVRAASFVCLNTLGDLYQAFIKGKDKGFETHSIKNAHEGVNIEINIALVEDITTTPVNNITSTLVEAKSLEILNLFETLNDKVKSLG